MAEIWKDIKGYEGKYQVSNLGNVRSLNYHRMGITKLLKIRKDKDGYNMAYLVRSGYNRPVGVHRLVAQAFIPNPNKYPCVNHKNEVKDDNRVENLEWCAVRYNTLYGTGVQRTKLNQPNRIEIEVDGVKYLSLSEAARSLSSSIQALKLAIRKGQTSFKGHKIEIKKEVN